MVCIQAVFILMQSIHSRHKKLEHLACKRLEFIRQIAELAYVYSHDTDLFYRKICGMMHIEELKKKLVIDFNLESKKHRLLRKEDSLSQDDVEFYYLIKNDFNTRELSVIFGHRNPKSIYVKKCRLMKKIRK